MNWNLKSALYRMFWAIFGIGIIIFLPKWFWFGVVLFGFNCFLVGVFIDSYMSNPTKDAPDLGESAASESLSTPAPKRVI